MLSFYGLNVHLQMDSELQAMPKLSISASFWCSSDVIFLTSSHLYIVC